MARFRIQSKGFTLIELLVVISIIALLVGILLPALGAARKTAQNSVCMSNQRQVGIAIHSYATDNKDFVVLHGYRTDGVYNVWQAPNEATTVYWTGNLAVNGYGAERKMYKCPSFESGDNINNYSILYADMSNPGGQRWRDTDYGINWYSLAGRNAWEDTTEAKLYRSSRLDQVEDSTGTLLTADSWYEIFREGTPQHATHQRGSPVMGGLPTSWGGPNGRHPGTTCNVLWTDGHVSGVTFPNNNSADRINGPWGLKQLGAFTSSVRIRVENGTLNIADYPNVWDLW